MMYVLVTVGMRNSQKNQKAGSNGSYRDSLNIDARILDALQHDLHADTSMPSVLLEPALQTGRLISEQIRCAKVFT